MTAVDPSALEQAMRKIRRDLDIGRFHGCRWTSVLKMVRNAGYFAARQRMPQADHEAFADAVDRWQRHALELEARFIAARRPQGTNEETVRAALAEHEARS